MKKYHSIKSFRLSLVIVFAFVVNLIHLFFSLLACCVKCGIEFLNVLKQAK